MKFFGFLALLFLSLNTKASVWVAQNQWDQNWEKRYSEWVASSVTPQFFVQNNIATDCADAAISLRWIFARTNSLPAASTTSSSLLSNLSSQWDHLKTAPDWQSDERFRKALHAAINSTDTRTLFKDLYPIKLNSRSLVPGAVFINATSVSGHAEWISKTSFDGMNNPIMFFSSTVPQRVRETLVYPFMKTKWPVRTDNGFMRFRWAVQSQGHDLAVGSFNGRLQP